ncbi:hypothetical protein ACVWWO_007569 [Bradyrhizobium sp. F1.13.1]
MDRIKLFSTEEAANIGLAQMTLKAWLGLCYRTGGLAMVSVWLYVSVANECVKVFGSYDTAIEWLREYDPDGMAVEYSIEEENAPSIVPKRSDIQILIGAFLEARSILGEYLEPNMPRSAGTTVDKLMDALTNDQVLAALSRVEGRQRFGLVEVEYTG